MIKITMEKRENLLYTTSKPDEKPHRCVVVFDKKRAISYQHGSHSSLKEGEDITLYNVMNPELKIETVVSVICEKFDFIVFELADQEFPDYPPDNYMADDQKYFQLGINQDRNPVWKEGTVLKMCYGYSAGTSRPGYDDPGSGIFNSSGRFIGIPIAKMNFPIHQTSDSAINDKEPVDHLPNTKMICSMVIKSFLKLDYPNISFFKDEDEDEDEDEGNSILEDHQLL